MSAHSSATPGACLVAALLLGVGVDTTACDRRAAA
jgi:hypothetical protein